MERVTRVFFSMVTVSIWPLKHMSNTVSTRCTEAVDFYFISQLLPLIFTGIAIDRHSTNVFHSSNKLLAMGGVIVET